MPLDIAQEQIGSRSEIGLELTVLPRLQAFNFPQALQLFHNPVLLLIDGDFLVSRLQFDEHHFMFFRRCVIVNIKGGRTSLGALLVELKRLRSPGFAAFGHLDQGVGK